MDDGFYELRIMVPDGSSDRFIDELLQLGVKSKQLKIDNFDFDMNTNRYDVELFFGDKSLGLADEIMRKCTAERMLYSFTPVLA